MLKKSIILFLLILFYSVCYALTGNEIIQRAIEYKDFGWYCNTQNARVIKNTSGEIVKSNIDADPNNNITEYPFYSLGAKYKDANGQIQTATGQHTGVPYAWGLRETTDMFGGSDGSSGKLTWIYSGTRVLAGNHNTTYENDSVNKYGCKRKTGVRHQFCV